MDRSIVWTGAQPRSVDFLQSERNTATAVAKVIEALAGTATFVSGLACTPNSPAALNVIVGPGQIYSLQNVDSTAYSSLTADTAHQVMKQGLLMDAVTLSCPAPGTVGQSINYLVQATFQEVDGGSVVLPYYNSANPTAPYSGPGGANTPNYTLRQDQCLVAVKAGVAATTGSQTTPAPDAGYVGLWVVTVANGQATITSGNISLLATAPYLGGTLAAAGLALQSAKAATAGVAFTPVSATLRTKVGTFTAPCKGIVIAKSIFNINSPQPVAGTNTIDINGSASGSDFSTGGMTDCAVLAVAAGTAVTVTASYLPGTSGGTFSASTLIYDYIFIPTL